MNEAMLYVTEFTMSDGTKRRPLVERCEECRPRQTDDDEVSELRLWRGEARWWRATGEEQWSAMIDQRCAAALFRCSVEDWLRNSFDGGTVTLCDDAHCGVEVPLSDNEVNNGWTERLEGSTIHHALVTAAHTVADVQGVEP